MTRMARLGLVVSSFVVVLGGITAQAPLRFKGSLYAGICTSQIHGDGVAGFNKWGITAGPLLEISRDNQRWEWGLIYTQKGSRRVPNPKAGDYNTWRYRFTYLDIPIARLWDPQDWWWFGVGIQPSVLLNAEEDFFSTGYTPLTTPSLKRYDLGLMAIAGVQYTDALALEIRISQSALPISERPQAPVLRWDNFLMNMAIQAGMKLSFKSS